MTNTEEDLLKSMKDKCLYQLQSGTLLCFGLTLMLIGYMEPIFNFLGVGSADQEYKVTTLGLSATIMILYSMVCWPYI